MSVRHVYQKFTYKPSILNLMLYATLTLVMIHVAKADVIMELKYIAPRDTDPTKPKMP